MSAPRPTRRVRRVATAAALLGAAGVLIAPAAAFADYNDTSVAANTSVLGTKYGPSDGGSSGSSGSAGSGASSSGSRVLGAKYDSGSLAFTGFEAGAVGLVGAALVAGGGALIIGGRRRTGAR